MRRVRHVSLVIFAVCLTGCLNSATLIKVKPDGSGTIEQTLLMNTAARKSMMGGLDAQGQFKTSGPFTEAELKKAAEAMGKGVRFVSSTPMAQGGFEGAKALFAFDDISAIRVQQDPGVGAQMGAKLSTSSSSPVTFAFARQGETSVLTVTFDEKTMTPPPTSPPAAAPNIDPAMLAMIKQLFQGFKLAVDLEVEGKILKTNADYVNGSRITLLELELSGLLEDEAKLKALQGKVGASIAEIRPFLKDVKGVKLNHSVVTVEYR
jgi:hypothetical protein